MTYTDQACPCGSGLITRWQYDRTMFLCFALAAVATSARWQSIAMSCGTSRSSLRTNRRPGERGYPTLNSA